MTSDAIPIGIRVTVLIEGMRESERRAEGAVGEAKNSPGEWTRRGISNHRRDRTNPV